MTHASCDGLQRLAFGPAYKSDVALVRAGLDERDFSAAWAEGQALGAEQAIAYALGEDRTDQKTSVLAPQLTLHHEASDGDVGHTSKRRATF